MGANTCHPNYRNQHLQNCRISGIKNQFILQARSTKVNQQSFAAARLHRVANQFAQPVFFPFLLTTRYNRAGAQHLAMSKLEEKF